MQALKAIGDGMAEDAAVLIDLPVLSRDGVLRPGSEVVLDDAPWFRGKIDETAIHWLHPHVNPAAAAVAGVPRLSAQILETLEAQPSISYVRAAITLATRLTETIRSEQFRAGLDRLIQHEHPE